MKPQLMKAQIHPTNRCNLRCIFCDVPERYKGWIDLEEEKFIAVCSDLCQLNPKVVTISGGGEPILRAGLLMKMMKILSSAGIEIELITNGTLISEKLAEHIARYCELYRVSLHSTSVKLDEILRGRKNSIKLTFEGIKKVVKWKSKLGKEKPTIDVDVVLTKFNVGEVDKMIRSLPSLGVNKISLRLVHKWGEQYLPSSEQLQLLWKKFNFYEKLADKEGIELNHDFLLEDVFSGFQNPNQSFQNNLKGFDKMDGIFCTLPFREVVVFADGRVAPCCNFIIDPISEVVDSIKERNLADIWFGEKFNYLRKLVTSRKLEKLPQTCKECSIDLKPIDRRYR